MTTTNEHTERAELIRKLKNVADILRDDDLHKAAALLEAQRPALKPLTDEQIDAEWHRCGKLAIHAFRHAVRFAEAAHGITGEAQHAEQAKGQEAAARILYWHGPRHYPVPHGGIAARTYAEFPEEEANKPDSYWKNGPKLYTTPPAQPAREWVDMTEKELWLAIDGCANKYEACRAIMSRLREKNAGLPVSSPKPQSDAQGGKE